MPPISQTIETAPPSDDDTDALEKLLATAAEMEKSENGEVDELDALLAAADEVERTSPPKKPAAAPKLQEDDTFAAAFASSSVESSNLALTPLPSASSSSPAKEKEIDSSDDEDVKNFLEQKYNEYGRDVNKKLKQQNEEEMDARISKEVFQTSTPSKPRVGNAAPTSTLTSLNRQTHSFKSKVHAEAKTSGADNGTLAKYFPKASPVFTDPIFGMRIINPLISSTVLVERMSDRKPVHFNSIAMHCERGDLSKDWVIAGAILSKSPVKTTKTGGSFSIWKLSDLKGDMKQISLFLFKNAHKELWKTSQGMVVAILNPSIFERREERGDAACLSIDTAQKLMILGQSKDMGTCKSKKKNGEPCTAIVNLGDCDYCIYHVKQEFGKMSKRSELQSSTAGRGLQDLRNKVLGKSEVFYAGQSYTAVPAKKSAKQTAKDNLLLMNLSDYNVSPSARSVNHASSPAGNRKDVPYATRAGPVSKMAGVVEVNVQQRNKDLERLKLLEAEQKTFAAQKEQMESSNTPKLTLSVPDKFKDRQFSFSQKSPQLSKDSFSIDVNISSRQAGYSKHKALEVLKSKPIAKANPNFIKYRGTTDGKKRAIDEINDKFGNEAKKRKIQEDHREEERKSRIQKIMEATSSHTNLVESREMEEQEKYFNKLEKKEAMEEKMLNTFKVACKAVMCLKCKYTAFSAADRCKEEKHPLKVLDTEKRFFACKDCGNRMASVHRMPQLSCKNCKGSRWERTAMIRERKVGDSRDVLCIRGDEETFLGSLAAKGNLNLLVPDE